MCVRVVREGLMLRRFNSTLQVTGLPDAIYPWLPRSPHLTAWRKTKQTPSSPPKKAQPHTQKANTQSRQPKAGKQKLVKVKNRRRGKKRQRKKRRKWGVSKNKREQNWVKVKERKGREGEKRRCVSVSNLVAQVGKRKGNIDKRGCG